MRTALFLALLTTGVASAAPLATQGRLVDPAGGPINGVHTVRIQLFDSVTGGAELWSHPYNDLPIVDGFYSVMLDGEDAAGRSLDDAMGAEAWMLVSVDGAPMLPRQPIQSVPRAFRAQSSMLADRAEMADEAVLAELASEADHAATADEALLASLATEADHAATADEALLASLATEADHAATADEALLASLATEADHAATADEALLAALATEADHAATADEAVLAELASEADRATVAESVPVIDATAGCSTPGAIGFDTTLASGAICDGSAWQVLQSAAAAQGQRRLLVADRLRSTSELYGNSSWQYHTLPQQYTVTTHGGNLRVYFKAMTYLHATPTNGSAQQAGLIIHPIIDGVEAEYCDYLYVRGWGTADDMHGPIVCDVTYELPAGEHTVGFVHRYYGHRTILYGGPAKSSIQIEELPTAIDYQGDW